MKKDIPLLIKKWKSYSRLNTYSELGRKIGVTQQTVSRWASGVSKPSAKYETQLMNILSSNQIFSGSSLVVGSVVLQPLPLQSLTPESFEEFCRDLFIYNNYNDMKRFGKKGDRQFGIDLYSGEYKTVVQCKQTKKVSFSKSLVRKVFKEYDEKTLHERLGIIPKRKILAVSANVPAEGVRESEKNGWEVYDIEELTHTARNLTIRDKVRLIENYFTNNRQQVIRDCLGINDYTFNLFSPKLYFERFDKMQNGFTISNRYIDSFSKLDDLQKIFLESYKEKSGRLNPIIIVGDVGMGKTRLLKEFCKKNAKRKIIIVEECEAITEDELRCIFEQDVVIIDNAHNHMRTVKRILSARHSSYEQNVAGGKMPILIITTRKSDIQNIENVFSQDGIQISDSPTIRLEKPNSGQCYDLVLGIIENSRIAHMIANVSSNNPFIAVMLANNIKNGQLSQFNISKLGAPGSVLYVFLNDLAKYGCGLSHKEEDVRDILHIIALIQPVYIDNNFKNVIKRHTNLSDLDIIAITEKLLIAGMLIKRMGKVYIYPEIFGNYLCYDFLKDNLEFKEGVLKPLLDSQYRTNIISNLALFASDNPSFASDFMSVAWSSIKVEFMVGDIFKKNDILNDIIKVAFYQPQQAIEFVKMAISVRDCQKDGFSVVDRCSLLHTATLILENIAHRMDYISVSVELLVNIADEFEIKESEKNFALEVIQNLLQPNIAKPIGYREAILDNVLVYIKKSRHQKKFIKILSSTLDTSSVTYLSDARTITLLQSMHDNTDEESQKLCRIIFDYARLVIDGEDLPMKIAAIELLGDVINYKLSDKNSSLKNEIIQFLHSLCITSNIDSVVTAKTYLELQRYHDRLENLELVLSDVSIVIAVFALDPYHHYLFSYVDDYMGRQEILRKWITSYSDIIVEKFKDDPVGFYYAFVSIQEKANECELFFDGSYLLGVICPKMSCAFNRGLVEKLKKENGQDKLQYPIGALITYSDEREYCIETIKALIHSEDSESVVNSANTVAYCFDKIDSGMIIPLIDLIIGTNNVDAILIIIWHLPRLLVHDESFFPYLISRFCKIENPRIAVAVTDLFAGSDGKTLINNLQQNDVVDTLSNLETVRDLNYSTQAFVCEIANVFPTVVASFFAKRIFNKKDMVGEGVFNYVDIPYGLSLKLDAEAKKAFLTETLLWINKNIDQPMIKYEARKLLKLINLDGNTVLSEIERAKKVFIKKEDRASLMIIEILLSLLEINYLVANYNSIETILRSLRDDGGLEVENILNIFVPNYVPSSKSRTPGSPSDYDVNLLNISEEALKNIPYDFITRQLFERMAAYAKYEISNDEKTDKEWGF